LQESGEKRNLVFCLITKLLAIVIHSSLHNEVELLNRLQTGNEEAFSQLFNHYRPVVYNVAYKFLKSPVLAEEIVQDVFLKIWLKRNEMCAIKNFNAYLFIMARNFIFDRIKKMSYELEAKSALKTETFFIDDTEYLVRQHECQQLLKEAVDLLPQQQQLVYTLAKVEGLSHEAIAEKMQISKLTVKKHMAMALQAIRNYLDTRLYDILLVPLMGLLFLFIS
jgi:RNA polymerase sigma-70 factor (ECF subfamily)